jgi:hypothetical protein
VALVDENLGYLFVGRDPAGRRVGGGAIQVRSGELTGGLSLRGGGGPWGIGGFLLKDARRSAAWAGLAAERGGRSGLLALRVAGRRWRLGLEASATEGALTYGSDPVTGHRLDRPHRALQLHGRLAGTDWSAGLMGRESRRGGAFSGTGDAMLEMNLVWRPRSRPGPDRLELRLRATPVRRATLVARFRPGPSEIRLRFSRQSDGVAASELAGFDFFRNYARTRVGLAVVAVDGTGSRVWMLRRPGTGIYPVWLRPAEFMGAVAAELVTGSFHCGIWSWYRVGPARIPDSGIGLACRFSAGRLVQRLHRRPLRAGPSGPAPTDPLRGTHR